MFGDFNYGLVVSTRALNPFRRWPVNGNIKKHLVVLSLVLIFPSVVLAEETLPPDIAAQLQAPHLPDQLLVRFEDDVSAEMQGQVLDEANCTILLKYRIIPGLFLVKVQAENLAEVLTRYTEEPAVKYAEPNYLGQWFDLPDDPYFDLQWGLHNIGQTIEGNPGIPGADIRAIQAWQEWTGDPEFKIAVMDCGIDYTHPDLSANIWTNPMEAPGDANGDGCPGFCDVDDDGDGLIDEDSEGRQPGEPGYSNDLVDDDDENGYIDDVHGYDFHGGDGDPMPSLWMCDDPLTCQHGTFIAGIIGAVTDNNQGIAGINQQCQIVALKIGNMAPVLSAAIEAVQYMVENNIRVANCSWGGRGPMPNLRDAIEVAQESGVLFIFAAGNWGINIDEPGNEVYPAVYDLSNMIVAAATNNRDERASFSDYGPVSVDLAAPGVDIYSIYSTTVWGSNGYKYWSGTSFAAPHVVGVVGLVMSRFPDATWQEVRGQILRTVRYPTLQSVYPHESLQDLTVTGGVVNAYAAVVDCNDNSIFDSRDIADGTSLDCNENDIPDECDISNGTSEDCNRNRVPDECEDVPCVICDLNNDGRVDEIDLKIMKICLDNYSSGKVDCYAADLNGDGEITDEDWQLFEECYMQHADPSQIGSHRALAPLRK